MRKFIARLIYPEIFQLQESDAYDIHWLLVEIRDSASWLSEFPSIRASMLRILQRYWNMKGVPRIGTEEISEMWSFREKLRNAKD